MYKVAGVSKFKGEFKVRFANDMTRVKLLQKAGNTDIELVDLPKAMNKPAAVTYLKTTALYKVPAQAAAIDAADAKYNGKKDAVKVKKAVKPTATKAKGKPSLADIKARAKSTAKVAPKPAVVKTEAKKTEPAVATAPAVATPVETPVEA